MVSAVKLFFLEGKMSELVADCPRCSAKSITFDLMQENYIRTAHGWQNWYETFCICRHCRKATIFILSEDSTKIGVVIKEKGLANIPGAVNDFMRREGYVNIRNLAAVSPPDHLPENINAAFNEGAACMSIHCFNASGTMFRLCIDLATRPMLPESNSDGLNNNIRRSLGLRLIWLFDNNKLPESLKELASCIKEDGNDGAHAGTLTKEDAEDQLDFTSVLLERLYTEPEKLKLAEKRRQERRS